MIESAAGSKIGPMPPLLPKPARMSDNRYVSYPEAGPGGGGVKQTRVFFTVRLVEQLDCKKLTSIRCDGFLYFRGEGGWKDADQVWTGFNDRAES